MYPREDLRRALALYAVTDRAWLGERTLAACVEEALAGGATFVQLREKEAPRAEVVLRARALAPLCRAAGVPFVVNDDVAAARLAGADGVHVGQDDAACADARAELGPDAIVGVSVQTVEQALAAQADGAEMCIRDRSLDDHLSRTPVARRLKHATRTYGGPPCRVPICACSGWGFPSRAVAGALVRSYRTVSAFLPFLRAEARVRGGVFFSVALSVGSPRPAVSWHLALWSPDFPHAEARDRLARSLSLIHI